MKEWDDRKTSTGMVKALPVFWRRGFADASLHELELATGVNKSGLYSEFKDKEDLFMQSLQYYLESLEKKELLTAEPLGWNNIERFLKLGPCSRPTVLLAPKTSGSVFSTQF